MKRLSNDKYTKEQREAIEKSGCNILVSASAGSGKTSVLIERIINKLKKHNYDIDEMLVVTFTEAAANEMKQRLRSGLTKEISSTLDNRHLYRQLPLLSNAYISTFHSFCNSVIQRFFYLINFEAKYKICDDAESYLIEHMALEELFSDLFEQEDKQFLTLVERFTSSDDENLKMIISTIYHRLRSLPDRGDFISYTLSIYDFNSFKDFPFYDQLTRNILSLLNDAERLLKESFQLSLEINHSYQELYNDDMEIIKFFRNNVNNFDACYTFFEGMKFKPFSKAKDTDDPKRDIIKNKRDEAKKLIDDLKKKYYLYREATMVNTIKNNKTILADLYYVVDKFNEKVQTIKKEKGIVDFSDLEVLALQILSLNNFDNEATNFYRRQFKEILVDEFQDTNLFQTTIINAVSRGNNLFMVGDVKQSIYSFRNAEPSIFQALYKEYSLDNGEGSLINLNKNFRSRREVIDFINFLFSQLMDEEMFEIDYDDKAALVYGQTKYPDTSEKLINVAIIDKSQFDDELTKAKREAHYCAKTIRDLIDNHHEVYDFKKGEMRPVRYRDIVILSRTKADEEIYNDIFKEYNIPFLTSDLTGYFNSVEVMTVVSFLTILDNPLQDIPLVSVLRSIVFGVTESDLIEIKVFEGKDDYFFQKVVNYANSGNDIKLKEKLQYFETVLNTYREKVINEPLSEIIYSFYHETNYYDYVSGELGGKQRQANLDALLDLAKNYEHLTSNSLFRFVNLINFLNERDKDLNQARTVSDNEDLVQFMSIHKSKGLEFPIVFITNLSKEYNTKEENGVILFDKKFGITMKYMDIDRRVKYRTVYQNLVKEKKHKELLSEELRLLYVALTRAKERIYLVGTVNDFEKEKVKLVDTVQQKDPILPKQSRAENNFFALILKALSRHKLMENLLEYDNCIYISPKFSIELITEISTPVDTCEGENHTIDFSEYTHSFSERLNYRYPHIELTNHFAKQTISDIKRERLVSDNAYVIGENLLKKPRFIEDSNNSLARGTSFHLFMQHIDYYKIYDKNELVNLRDSLINKEILNKEEADLIDLDKILKLFDTDIIKDIKSGGKVFKELPFTTLLPGNKVYHDGKDDIDILVQGVMDLFVLFDNYAYLIDFKSDRVFDEGDLKRIKSAYQLQISIYKEAMKKIYSEKEIKAYLYLFTLNRYIEM